MSRSALKADAEGMVISVMNDFPREDEMSSTGSISSVAESILLMKKQSRGDEVMCS